MTVIFAVVLLVLVINPPRRLSELPTRPEAVGQGALITLAAMVATGVAAEPVLDWLDVSLSTFRIAVGGLIVVRSIIDLLRAPGHVDDDGGAVVPAFFPVLFRPEFVLAGMLVAAERNVFVMTAGAAVALALVVGVTLLARLRLARSLGIVVSAGALVLAIDLMVDGVLAL